MEQWTPLAITNPADREAVALALFRTGYEVRTRKVRDGKKTVIYLEYRGGNNSHERSGI